MPLVVDASAIAPLALPEEDAAFAESVLVQVAQDGSAIVPSLFWNELLNVFALGERRGRIMPDETDDFLNELEDACLFQTQDLVNARDALIVARRSGLTVYDACYLALAAERRLTLATLDQGLKAAAVMEGVSVFP